MIPRMPLTVKRTTGGEFVDGIWVPGAETEFTARYSVQPTSPDDMAMLPEGRRDRQAFTLFGSTALRKATDEGNADRVLIYGEWYEVNAHQPWRNGLIPHERMVATRLEEQPDE